MQVPLIVEIPKTKKHDYDIYSVRIIRFSGLHYSEGRRPEAASVTVDGKLITMIGESHFLNSNI